MLLPCIILAGSCTRTLASCVLVGDKPSLKDFACLVMLGPEGQFLKQRRTRFLVREMREPIQKGAPTKCYVFRGFDATWPHY